MKIKPEIIKILSAARVEGNQFYLTGQLDRKTYLDVNKVLDSIGGKWNKKLKCHIFESDIEEVLADIINTGEYTDKKKDLQFFPTPTAIVKQMVELAEIQKNSKCLEPSCGRGSIVDELVKKCEEVDIVEIDTDNYNWTMTNYGCRGGLNCDFLSIPENPIWDRVIMNPPFHTKGLAQADVSHILHAWKFIKSGGILTSIVSESPFFRSNSKSLDFLQWLSDNNAEVIELPVGAFAESGTNVKTRIIKVKK